MQQSKNQLENDYEEYTYEPSFIIERSYVTNLIQEDSTDFPDRDSIS